MMRCVLSLAPVVVVVAFTGCSREGAVGRLARECREIVDGATNSEDATNPDVATVKRVDMEAVIRSEQWATTPLRKVIQAEFNELETSRGYTADKYDAAWVRVVNKGGERDAIWRAAFDNDLRVESDSAEEDPRVRLKSRNEGGRPMIQYTRRASVVIAPASSRLSSRRVTSSSREVL